MKIANDDHDEQENDLTTSRVYKLPSNTSNSSIVMTINGSCSSLFIIESTIYCSMSDQHQVVTES